MRRLAHLFVILAIVPGVVLPGPVAICLCAAMSCAECDGCCVQPTPPKTCCAAHAASSGCSHDAKPGFVARKACAGCLHLAPEKHQTPRPQAQSHELPDFAHLSCGALPPLALAAITPAPLSRPTSHAPPDGLRSLPLLI
jgi:hypothetical protein